MRRGRQKEVPDRRGEEGFTLIEVIVVFAILGLVMAMVLSGPRGPDAVISLRAAANQLAAGLREARSRAIEADRPVTLTVDLAGRRWWIGNDAGSPLPAVAAIRLDAMTAAIRRGNVGAIRFEPDGSSTGGRIEIAKDGHRIAVGVDWITGRVLVGNAY